MNIADLQKMTGRRFPARRTTKNIAGGISLIQAENFCLGMVELDPDQSQFTRRLTDEAIHFVNKYKNDRFFLLLSHVMPHVPIAASRHFQGTSPMVLTEM